MKEVLNRDELDTLIDKYHMTERTGKSREEILKMLKKAMTCLNLAHCMCDVMEWLIFDADCSLAPFDASLEKEYKRMLRQMKRYMTMVASTARDFTREIHYTDVGEQFQGESDWWYNIVRLIEDRTGSNYLKTRQLLEWIDNMPSEMHMFNVKLKDFKRLIDYDPKPDTTAR